MGVLLRQTAEQEYLKCPMKTPPDSSVSFTSCPLSYRTWSRGHQRYQGWGPSNQGLRSEYDRPPHVTVVPACPPPCQGTALTPMAPHCALQGPDGAGELGAEACAVHALFLILHSGNILDSGPGDANSKQADVQTLSLAFEAVTRIHFPEALGHVALRLVPCPPICAAAYALVSKYCSGVEGWGYTGSPRCRHPPGGLRD